MIRHLPVEFYMDVYFDLYSNNQRSYLFSSAFKKMFNIELEKVVKLPNYNQYVGVGQT